MKGNIPPRESSLETALVLGVSEKTHGGTASLVKVKKKMRKKDTHPFAFYLGKTANFFR